MKKLFMFGLGLVLMSSAFGATMTITIPNEVVGDVVEAFATEFQYPTSIPDPLCEGDEMDCSYIPNPMSKSTFAKRQIRAWIRQQYIDWKRDQAVNTAQTDSVATAETEVEDVTVE